MAQVNHIAGGIYRISSFAPTSDISFNQFLIVQVGKKPWRKREKALFTFCIREKNVTFTQRFHCC